MFQNLRKRCARADLESVRFLPDTGQFRNPLQADQREGLFLAGAQFYQQVRAARIDARPRRVGQTGPQFVQGFRQEDVVHSFIP